jgi:alpha-tubulin suppressor-like RCC1 family protein
MHRVRSSLWSAAAAVILVVAGCDNDNPNISGISALRISRIELAPRIDTIFVADTAFPGDTVQYQATVFLHSGDARTDVPLVWETSDSSVAIVDQDGTVFPVGYGTTKVFASASERGEATLVVAPPPVTGLTVTPALDTIGVGQTVQLTPVASNDAGVIPGVRYDYSSSAPEVASVSATGLVQGLTPGTTTITISIFGGVRTVAVDIVVVEGLATANGVFTQLDAGRDFTCGRIPGDRAFCWGIDSVFQLGAVRADTVCVDIFGAERIDSSGVRVSDFPCSLLPLPVQGDRTFTQITAGSAHACGLSSDGTAWCWGGNDIGQLGNGTTRDVNTPTLVTSALRFTQLSAGTRHTCGLISGGAPYCWGDDGFGQLGNGERVFPAPSTTPIPVEPLELRLTTISAGLTHSCGLDTGGRPWCWGSNAAGELGTGALSDQILHQAVQVQAPPGTFTSISAGDNVTCAITTANTLYCWGAGGFGQLGVGGTDSSGTPRQVAGSYSAVAVGGTHVCALNTGGQAVCWGHYDVRQNDGSILYGPGGVSQSPQSSLVPTPIESNNVTFTAITSGRRHSCAMTADGAGYCWGSNVHGPFGDGLQALLRTRALQRISATPEPTQP